MDSTWNKMSAINVHCTVQIATILLIKLSAKNALEIWILKIISA